MSEKSKNILLGVLIVGLVSMTVAYAALSTSLQINGTANVAATRWDIHFANIQNVTTGDGDKTSAGVTVDTGALDQNGGTLINNLAVKLNKPGDMAVVTFDIVNDGTIDAKLNSFTKSISYTPDGEQTQTDRNTVDVVTYTIDCNTGSDQHGGIENEVLAKKTGENGTATSCKLKVVYNDNEFSSETQAAGQQKSQTAGQDQTVDLGAKTFTLSAAWNYVQN